MSIRYLHTMLRVRDLDAALRFYATAFGYALRARRPGPDDSEIAFLALPDDPGELQLMQAAGQAAFAVPERLMHLAYRVGDLDATLAGALAAGATLVKGPYGLPSGSRVAFVRDPDGYDLELVQKPAAAAAPASEGNRWDERFARPDYVYGEAPNVFLAAQLGALPPGGAVVSLGEGEGRNATFLAARGFAVTAVDSSARGLEKLRALADRRGVALSAVEADVTAYDLGEARWDGVVNVFCHLPPAERQALWPRVRRALKPGGVFIAELFRPEQPAEGKGGPPDERLRVPLSELTEAFAGFERLYAAEEVYVLDEGPLHQGPRAVSRLVVRKPG